MLAAALALVAAGLFLVFFDQPLFGALCLLAALSIAIAGAILKTGKGTKAIAQGTTRGMWTGLQEAETSSPGLSTAEQAVSNAGGFAGQQVFAPRKKQLRFRGIGALADANQRLIDAFKKLFG